MGAVVRPIIKTAMMTWTMKTNFYMNNLNKSSSSKSISHNNNKIIILETIMIMGKSVQVLFRCHLRMNGKIKNEDIARVKAKSIQSRTAVNIIRSRMNLAKKGLFLSLTQIVIDLINN